VGLDEAEGAAGGDDQGEGRPEELDVHGDPPARSSLREGHL